MAAHLRPDQVVFVNCPGRIDAAGVRKLAEVESAFTSSSMTSHILLEKRRRERARQARENEEG